MTLVFKSVLDAAFRYLCVESLRRCINDRPRFKTHARVEVLVALSSESSCQWRALQRIVQERCHVDKAYIEVGFADPVRDVWLFDKVCFQKVSCTVFGAGCAGGKNIGGVEGLD